MAGRSEAVVVRVSGANGATLAPGTALRHLHFDPLALGAAATQAMSLRNATSLDLHYRWDLRPADASVTVGALAPPPPPSLLRLTGADPAGAMDASRSSSGSRAGGSGGTPGSNLAALSDEVFEGFRVSPRCGVLRARSDTPFAVVCAPGLPQPFGVHAVLVLERVPAPAVPSPQQPQLLAQLQSNGHGPRLRCRAWFDQVCAAAAAAAPASPGDEVKEVQEVNKVGALELETALAALQLPPHLSRPVRDLLKKLTANAAAGGTLPPAGAGRKPGAPAGGAGWGLDGRLGVEEFMGGACPDALAEAIEDRMARVPFATIQQVHCSQAAAAACKQQHASNSPQARHICAFGMFIGACGV